MPQLTFYHAAPSRASVVHWMLEELGEPYETHVLNLKAGDHRKPEYLAINPMAKVPAIKHGDVVITEVSAICTYLADAFPKAGLARADRRSAPRPLPEMAVLPAELPGARHHRSRLPAQGGGARPPRSATATTSG